MKEQAIDNLTSHDIERAILGAMLIDQDAIGVALEEKVDETYFFEASHSLIFRAIKSLYLEDNPVDQLTVSENLRKNKCLDLVGGEMTIGGLVSDTVSAANIKYHITILADKLLKRRLAMIGTTTKSDAESTLDGQVVLDKLENEIIKLQEEKPSGSMVKISDSIGLAVEHLAKLATTTGFVSGVETGFPKINMYTGGWQAGNMIVIAGRPAQGKSALSVTLAVNAAKAGVGVAFFSLEMSLLELDDRMLSLESGFDTSSLNYQKPEAKDWNRISEAANTLHNLPMWKDDTSGLTIGELSARAKRLKKQENIGLIIVDYLQLMSGNGESRQQEVATISRGLKTLAKNLKIPVIALSQLNRKLEDEKREPELSDLKESGSIEQDADKVIFVHNPNYQNFEHKDLQNYDFPDLPAWAIRKLIMKKNRQGRVGNVFVRKNQNGSITSLAYHKKGDKNEQSHNPIRSNGTGGNPNHSSYYDKE